MSTATVNRAELTQKARQAPLARFMLFGTFAAGLGAVVLLLFVEVGLSEERELAREEKRRRRATDEAPRHRSSRHWPRRPS